MGRINVTSRIFAEPLGSNIQTYGVVLTLIEQGWQNVDRRQTGLRRRRENLDATKENFMELNNDKELTEEND